MRGRLVSSKSLLLDSCYSRLDNYTGGRTPGQERRVAIAVEIRLCRQEKGSVMKRVADESRLLGDGGGGGCGRYVR